MKIHFYIRFHTKFGQSLLLSGNAGLLGNNDISKAFPLQYLNNDYWHGTVQLDEPPAILQYKYILRSEDSGDVIEWGDDRTLDTTYKGLEEIQTIDIWNHSGEYENVFYTDPFQKVLLSSHNTHAKVKSPKTYTHIFKIKAPLLKKHEVVVLLGSGPALGNWNAETPVVMKKENGWWSARLDMPREEFPISYKYAVYNIRDKAFLRYEGGSNRTLYGDTHYNKVTVMHDGFIRLANSTWHGAGVAVPVFSLRSKNSMGVGEFTDLKLLAGWAKKTGLKMIQILPVNDTTATYTWTDSYPYSAISAFALHPIYLNIGEVAGRKHAGIVKPYLKHQKELNALPQLDYESVLKLKIEAVKKLYEVLREEFLKDGDYQDFFEKNKHWLAPYAAFCFLRDKHGTPDFNQWTAYCRYDKEAVKKLVSPRGKHFGDIAFFYFVQYHLHLQLVDAADFAHRNGIILKGDIPIGIYRYSCDAWVEPDLYHMDQQAGAPPDDFAVSGQNWGFPTYNWERMARDGFEWWHRRFVQMSKYFDAFRIDHILGFFRIWSIPISAVEGIMGHFEPSLPVYASELVQRGVSFDYDRYCLPYITEEVLWELFGPNNEKFKRFLKKDVKGNYALRPEFATQRQVEGHFAGLPVDEENAQLKQGLFHLISNVIFFEQEGSQRQAFHFRFNVDETTSFRHLDQQEQQRLKALYIDYFYHRQDAFWMKEAMAKLPALKRSTNMLICGEDLGMVPHSVPTVMKQLGILSLEIQRMPKDPAVEFFHPATAPYLSVVMPSTHDMSTVREWWMEDRAQTQRFYNQDLAQPGEAPQYCEPWISMAIVRQHLQSPAMWSVFQLQDLLGMSGELRRANFGEERINVPANPRHYWKYRMHFTLDQLLKEKDFNEELRSYVESSGRA